MKSADYFSSNPADRTRLLTNCSKCTRLQQFSTAMDHSVGNNWNQHTQVQQLTRILRYGIQKESWLQYSHNRWRAIVTFGIVCKIRSSFIRPPAIFMTHSPNDIPETEADLIVLSFHAKVQHWNDYFWRPTTLIVCIIVVMALFLMFSLHCC